MTDLRANPYKADFPLLAANPSYAYLDNAATSQRAASVLEEQERFYQEINANPLRGIYAACEAAQERVGRTRVQVARFLGTCSGDGASLVTGAPAGSEVVFTRNATEALNLAAYGLGGALVLGPGDEVCVGVSEHHSNLVPWQQVCRRTGARLVLMDIDGTGRISEKEALRCIGSHTRIVAVGHVSNVLGTCNPVERIVCRAHEVGAVVVVDGAQAAPHLDVDVQELGCDFYALSAHKMLGPFGVGVLWGRYDLLERMEPVLCGGGTVAAVDTLGGATWATVPHRFEAGTQDVAGIRAFGEALAYYERQGRVQLLERERALTLYLRDRLRGLSFVEEVGPGSSGCGDRAGIVPFNVRGVHPHDVSELLDEHGVAIRAGKHCAEPLLRRLGLAACCRASVAFYNDMTDVDTLVEGLEHVRAVFG